MIPITVALAILAGLIIPRLIGKVEESRKAKAFVQMKAICRALELYKKDNGNYPTTAQGLRALAEKPALEPVPEKWHQYIEKIPPDPWKGQYVYTCPGINAPYELVSYGPDGIKSEDDLESRNMPDK